MRRDHLVRRYAFDLVNYVRRQLRIRRIQAGNDAGLGGYIEGSILVGYFAAFRLVRGDDQGPVYEYRIRQMLGHADARRIEVLDVADARLYGK